MKYWTMKQSLDRLIRLKEYDKEAYMHAVSGMMLAGIALGMMIVIFIQSILS